VILRLAPEIEQRLRQLAADTNHSVSFYVRELINHGLEDVEDYYRAAMVSARIRSGVEKVYSMAEVEANLGLAK
jgi:RHH-type transcriptional regulator, rel operon repressor / antitoxin RelB